MFPDICKYSSIVEENIRCFARANDYRSQSPFSFSTIPMMDGVVDIIVCTFVLFYEICVSFLTFFFFFFLSYLSNLSKEYKKIRQTNL